MTGTTILVGDCLATLRGMPSASVQCCVTSPPYFGLRDYGVEGQVGLEDTPEAYVARLVAIFAEVRRVLRDDGTCWLNLGDSYARSPKKGGSGPGGKNRAAYGSSYPATKGFGSSKAKDLLLIPAMAALALRADGWFLRADIIWSKPNPMPESVRDRPTSAHEHVFLLTKSERYFYDATAISEATSPQTWGLKKDGTYSGADLKDYVTALAQSPSAIKRRLAAKLAEGKGLSRNARNVWTISPQPFRGAHHAVMPLGLAERCIKAGTSEHGECPHCGAPWVRQTSRGAQAPKVAASSLDRFGTGKAGVHRKVGGQYQKWLDANPVQTVGWAPSCSCPAHAAVPQTVLDPFGGAGTTAVAAGALGRSTVLIELNPKYAEVARARLEGAPRKAAA